MLLHIVLLYLVACLAGEDDKLAHHVHAAEVDAWVGLAVALLLCHVYSLGEGHVGREHVENVVERAAEHGFNLENGVARVAKVVDGADDRQTCSYVGLEAELDTALQSGAFKVHVAVVIA